MSGNNEADGFFNFEDDDASQRHKQVQVTRFLIKHMKIVYIDESAWECFQVTASLYIRTHLTTTVAESETAGRTAENQKHRA